MGQTASAGRRCSISLSASSHIRALGCRIKWPIILHNGGTRGTDSHGIISTQPHRGEDRGGTCEKRERKAGVMEGWREGEGPSLPPPPPPGAAAAAAPQFCLHHRLHELFDCSLRTGWQTAHRGPRSYTESHRVHRDNTRRAHATSMKSETKDKCVCVCHLLYDPRGGRFKITLYPESSDAQRHIISICMHA